MPNKSKKVDEKLKKPKSNKATDKPSSDKKNTSLRLDKKTLKALKIRAIEEDTSVQKLIERLIIAYLNTPPKDTE